MIILKNLGRSILILIALTIVAKPLWIAWIVGVADATSGPFASSSSIGVGRILVPMALAVLAYGMFLLFRYLRRLRVLSSIVNPDIVIFVLGASLALIVPISGVAMYMFGASIAEVYVYAILASGYGLIWSWRHRRLLGVEKLSPLVERGQVDSRHSQTSLCESEVVEVRFYTVLLGMAGTLALLGASIGAYGLILGGHAADILFNLLIFGYCGFVALALWGATIARAYRSPAASLATTISNILICPLWPIGTLLFIYWLVWVRWRETWPILGSTA